MGKPILYCGDCGKVLKEEDFDRLKAGYLQNSPYCVACCPNVVLSTPPAPKQASPFPSSTRVRVLPASTPGRSLRAGASNTLPATFAAAIGGALVVVMIALAFSSAKPVPPPPERAPVARVAEPERKLEPETPPPPPRPRPVPVRPAEPEPPPRPVEAAAMLDRYLEDIRAIRDKDTSFKRADEIRSMLRRAAEIAGPRKAEVVALLDDYEKALAGPPKETPAPPTPAKPLGQVASFTLVDADTEKPVPGFDPIVSEATLDLGKLKLKKIDFAIHTSPKEVGSVETVIDKNPARGENSWPYSFTSNSVKDGFTGWTPTAGRHTLKCRIWSEGDRKGQAGPWVTFNFTVVDPR
ncbi:MAG TPA: hypothetical protein VF950_03830 [Planctomycetota bacterium]